MFASTPAQAATTTPSPTVPRKTDFPQTGLPLCNGPIGLGGSASPIPPISTSQVTTAAPVPSPAPAALPPPSLPPPYSTPMQVSRRAPSHPPHDLPANLNGSFKMPQMIHITEFATRPTTMNNSIGKGNIKSTPK